MSNNRNSFGFWFGLAAGAALGYYANTQKGRQYIAQAQNKANDVAGQLNDQAQTQWNTIKDKATNATEQGKSYASSLTDNVKTKIDQFSAEAKAQKAEVQSAFERGKANAQAKLNAKEAQIDRVVNDNHTS